MPKNKYCCPGCEAVLNPGTKIILIAQNKEGREGIILLSPWNHRVIMAENLLQLNEMVKLFCPACHYDLMDPRNYRFAKIDRVMASGRRSTVMISRIFSEFAAFDVK